MTSQQIGEFITKCGNILYEDYSWLKDHCYRTLKRPCSPNARNEHLAILDLIKEHEERQWVPISEKTPEDGTWNLFTDGKNVSVERYKADALDHFYPNGRWFSLDEAIAWMPLPEPYRVESEDK